VQTFAAALIESSAAPATTPTGSTVSAPNARAVTLCNALRPSCHPAQRHNLRSCTLASRAAPARSVSALRRPRQRNRAAAPVANMLAAKDQLKCVSARKRTDVTTAGICHETKFY